MGRDHQVAGVRFSQALTSVVSRNQFVVEKIDRVGLNGIKVRGQEIRGRARWGLGGLKGGVDADFLKAGRRDGREEDRSKTQKA